MDFKEKRKDFFIAFYGLFLSNITPTMAIEITTAIMIAIAAAIMVIV
jgi:hypothetical protein